MNYKKLNLARVFAIDSLILDTKENESLHAEMSDWERIFATYGKTIKGNEVTWTSEVKYSEEMMVKAKSCDC